NRVEPHSPGLRDRLWYGAGSMDSAVWAGVHGMNLLTSSVVFPHDDETPDFAQSQARQIQAFGKLRLSTPRNPRLVSLRVSWLSPQIPPPRYKKRNTTPT